MSEIVTARSHENRVQSIRWNDQSPLTMALETRRGMIHCEHGIFVGGKADGVEVVQIDTGVAKVMVLPTRGMSIWQIECDGVRFGWNSPVAGPVHPSLVPISENSGLGWLDGFDELVVRCGLESNGAPQHDSAGHLVYPLHGRIGNLPADSLSIEYDEASGRLELIGEVCESRLFFTNLRLQSRLRVNAGSADIELLDNVTNERSTAATMQLLYHINVGKPVLGENAKLLAPLEELAPKDDRSAAEIDQWNQFGPPESGYAERVYFAKLRGDDCNDTSVMLHNAEASRGLAVTYNLAGLPNFVLWKNTADEADGYVAGLEPATNFPNTRAFEESQSRVVKLKSGQTAAFRVTIHPITSSEAVTEMESRIKSLAGDHSPEIHSSPKSGWSAGV
ncbi:aldose 1-epimerase family protein [Stieleria varia]|uniref:DUF4432 domain-containing protein n=1 Tax=Stieleria varia TaxID=2528005 RepID=A0A5C6B7J2_9BACT|nr:aldose 1-epimerase family protein [Stieleria varia]TWU07562.1 hypothetical protein Pla52n_01350 [Stieleria varia]